MDPDQTAPIGAVCSVSTLFASIRNSSVMIGNHLQQTTSADNIFRCISSWRFKVKSLILANYWILAETRIPLKPVLDGGGRMLACVISIESHEPMNRLN